MASRPDQIWWSEEDPDERATSALTTAVFLEAQGEQVSEELEAISVYEGEAETELNDSDEAGTAVTNCVQSAIDSFVSDIVRQRVRLQFLTSKGKWQERQKAIGMGRAIEAMFDEAGIYGVTGIDVCRYGCVSPFGGAMKISPDYAGGRVLCEHISAAHLYVDPRDARMGKPRMLTYADDFAPEVLAAQYPKVADEIMELAETAGRDVHLIQEVDEDTVVSTVRRVMVYELWHLPSGNVDPSDDKEWGIGGSPTHDGRHIIVCGDVSRGEIIALCDEPWALPTFPVAVFRPYRKMKGWRGHSLVDRMKSTQRQIDRWQRRIDQMMNLFSRTMFYLNSEAGVKESTISNDWARIIEGRLPPSEAISVIAANAIPPELFKRLEDLIQWTRDFSGKTELTMMGKRPVGVESGTALRTLLEEEGIRHTDIFRAWEEFCLSIGKTMVECCRLVAARNPDFSLFWGDDDDLREIKWNEIDLKSARFKMRVWPVNLLPSTPSAKLEKLVELFQLNGISREQLVVALASEFPDMRAIMGDESALLTNIQRKLQETIDSAAVTDESLPHAFMALDLAEQVAVARINELETEGAPSDVIAAVSRWIELVRNLKMSVAPPPPPGGQSQAAPASTPLSGAAPPPVEEQAYV